MPNQNQIFDQIEQRIKAALDRLPTLVGNEAVNFFLSNFDKQGWQGQTFQPWKARKKETKNTLGYPILVNKDVRLKRSIHVTNKTENSVTVGTDVPYARIHNEGGEIHQAARSETFVKNRYKKGPHKGKFKKGVSAGLSPSGAGGRMTFREHTINMPQRQFMGDSPVLRDKLKQVCINEIIKSIKS